MILEIVIGILSFLILILMYILINLLNKLEKTEDIIEDRTTLKMIEERAVLMREEKVK